MGGDGARVAAHDWPRQDLFGLSLLQRGKRAGRERQERLAGNLLGRARRLLEYLDGPGEERDGSAGGEHRGRVVQGPRARHFDGIHPQGASDGGQALARFPSVGCDPGRRAAQDSGPAARRHGTERMERSNLGAAALRARERFQIERPRAVCDELAGADRGRREAAYLGDRRIRDRKQHQLGMA